MSYRLSLLVLRFRHLLQSDMKKYLQDHVLIMQMSLGSSSWLCALGRSNGWCFLRFYHAPLLNTKAPWLHSLMSYLLHRVWSQDFLNCCGEKSCYMIRINSLSPKRCGCDLKLLHFKHNWRVDILHTQANISLEWIPEDLIEGKSTLVEVIGWCHQKTSHNFSQFGLRSMSLYGIIRQQAVKQWYSSLFTFFGTLDMDD